MNNYKHLTKSNPIPIVINIIEYLIVLHLYKDTLK